MTTTPTIIDVYPAPDSLGIPISVPIKVIFDQEMDESTLNDGTFVLVGPDKTTTFGPVDITPFDEPGFEDEDILSSPYISGYVKGTISFVKVNSSGGIVDDSVKDYLGSGTEWLTQAIFTPNAPLEPNKKYTVVLAGDETPSDDFNSGIKTRTVFDTEKTAGTGTATLSFYGGYTGSINRTYIVVFTSAGAVGTAEYEWYDANDPLTVYQGVSSTGDRELDYGVLVTCDPDGSFVIGDTFTVLVKPSVGLENNYRWSFYTGSGSIAIPPSTSSASGIDSLTSTSTDLKIVSITPADKATNLDPLSVENIIITFNKPIDGDIITNEMITIWSEPVNGDLNSDIVYAGTIVKILSVSGDTITAQIS